MNRRFLLITVAALMLLGLSGPAFSVRYKVTPLPAPAGQTAEPLDINNAGQIVGMTWDGSVWITRRAARWDDGVFTDLFAGAHYETGLAGAISEDGMPVGDGKYAAHHRLLTWDPHTNALTEIGYVGVHAGGQDVNDSGEIVGGSYLNWGAGSPRLCYYHSSTGLITIGDTDSAGRGINNHHQIVGWILHSGYSRACVWDNASDTSPQVLSTLGGNTSAAEKISDAGLIVGTAETASGETHACLWDDGAIRDLGTLGGTYSEALGLNEHGQIVGTAEIADGSPHAFLHQDGQIHDLNQSLRNGTGWNLATASAINDHGCIVGHGTFEGSLCGFLLQPADYRRLLSINACYLDTSFSPGGGDFGKGVLAVADAADIVVEYDDGQTTFDEGSLFLRTSLFMDLSDNGPASALFAGGELVVRDGDNADLLTADVIDLRLDEVYDSAGILAGKGLFEVTGGSLEEDFGMPYGEIVQITFHLNPGDIADFSTTFTGVSDVTLTPIPEPTTLLLVGTGFVGVLGLIRRRRIES